MEIRQTCPRRSNSVLYEQAENLDTWREDNRCSFCGSLKPDIFMDRLERGDAILVPTDYSDKAYLKNDGGEVFKQTYRDCYTQCDGKPTCKGPADCTHWVTKDMNETKFYFDHLSEDKQAKFIEYLNAQKLKLGYPGYFYVQPYFITYRIPAK